MHRVLFYAKYPLWINVDKFFTSCGKERLFVDKTDIFHLFCVKIEHIYPLFTKIKKVIHRHEHIFV